ncbi:MAG TPA: PAS domain S-box protein, partial [Nitrospiraceae bacterium]|nr:PAS domain S-box protein [Nitrospiraceae bacterium]
DRLAAGIERLIDAKPDVVLLDLSLPDSQGLETLTRVHAAANGVPIVVLTSLEDEALGLQLIRAGAQDYLVKGQVTGPLLRRALRYAVERTLAEAALKHSERALHEQAWLLRSILGSMSEGVVVVDETGTPVLVNPAAQRILGAPPPEVSLAEWIEPMRAVVSDDASSYPSPSTDLPLLQVFRGGEVNNAELFIRRTGSAEGFWLSVSTRSLQRTDGTARGSVVVFHDITRHKLVEAALRDSEHRLRSLLESAKDVIFTVSTNGAIASLNPAFERWTGWSCTEWIGEPFGSLLYPDDCSCARDLLATPLAEGQALTAVLRVRTKAGGHVIGELTLVPHVAGGRVVGHVGIIRDITERKRAEEDRQKLAKDKLLLLESTGEGIYGIDLQGRCTFINKAGAKMLGYQPEELLGQNMHEQIHHQRHDRSPYPCEECRIYAVFQSGEGCHVEDEVMWRKDGTALPVEYSSFPVFEQGVITGAVVTFTDITQRKQAEAEREAALRQLRGLSRRLEQVREEERARIARELHDELGVMLTCLKIDLSQLNRVVSMVDQGAVRVHLQDKILSMMQPLDNTIALVQRLVSELRPGVLDDLGLVAALEWQAQQFHKRTGIACAFRSSLEDVEIDREQATAVFRICQEALTNVARHARATEVTVCLEQTRCRLLLEIKDNGCGIRPDKISGAGSLGLVGMRERAEQWGGSLIVTGRPGEGTTVTLSLPIVNSHKPAAKSENSK